MKNTTKTKFKEMDLSTLDVISLLRSIPVPLSFSGKNVTRGWVNTTCPFCRDDSSHLGINLTTKKFSCWICREKGYLFKFLKRVLRTDGKETFKYMRRFLTGKAIFYESPSESKREKLAEITLPSNLMDKPLRVHREYLESRGFDHRYLENIFHIKYTGQISRYKTSERKIDFKYRIIIPIYINEKLVNFTARDVTDMADDKYKNCPTDDALVTTKNAIYGYDNLIGDTGVLVEGPTDVWNLGLGAAGILGLKYTEEQIKLLYRKGMRRWVLFFDNEPMAQKIAKNLAKEMGSFANEVFILEPDKDISDPGEMTQEQVLRFWNLING